MSEIAKILLVANRFKRWVDRAGIPCPPLSILTAPRPSDLASVRDLLNRCMALGGELGESAEDLWDVLNMIQNSDVPIPTPKKTNTSASLPELSDIPEIDPLPISLVQAATKVATEQAELAKAAARSSSAKAAAEASMPAPQKKKGLFSWLSPEKPKSDDGDDDDQDDGHYKGGLR